MKQKKILYTIYLIGCACLGIGSAILWGLKGIPFVIGLMIITNPLIHKRMI